MLREGIAPAVPVGLYDNVGRVVGSDMALCWDVHSGLEKDG
jgi:hypothetical protein